MPTNEHDKMYLTPRQRKVYTVLAGVVTVAFAALMLYHWFG